MTTPADKGIAADPMQEIRDQVQTWDIPMLLKMEPYTHGEGSEMVRHELAVRGIGRSGVWVGFYQAFEEWFETQEKA